MLDKNKLFYKHCYSFMCEKIEMGKTCLLASHNAPGLVTVGYEAFGLAVIHFMKYARCINTFCSLSSLSLIILKCRSLYVKR